jgi:lysophospholipase L1-like esterase
MIPTIRPSIRNSIVGAIRGARVLPKVDYIVTIGSSVTVQTYSDHPIYGLQYQATRRDIIASGMDTPVIDRGVSGATIADTVASLPATLAFIGATSKKCLFIINIGTNDIGTISWSAYGQAGKDSMFAGLKNIVNQITSAGYMACLCTSNSRLGYESQYEEWADNMYRPLSNQLTPYWYNGPLTAIDFCRFYFINKSVPNWWQADGIHPDVATIPGRNLAINAVKALSVTNPASSVLSVIFSNQVSLVGKLGGITSVLAAASGSETTVYDTRGNVLSGVSFSWTGASNSSSGRGNAGNFDVSLFHDHIQKGNSFASTGSFPLTFTFGTPYAVRTGTLALTYNTATAGIRSTNFTSAGMAATLTIDGKATNPDVQSTTFVLDSTGKLVLTAALGAGAGGYGFSGAQFTFDAAAWTPANLFASGQKGGWYDPSDLSTMFQDTAGTTPVTADGQSVARINDKSGNGINLFQPTAGTRPIYKTDGTLRWLEFTTTAKHLISAANMPMSATNALAMVAGVNKISDAATAIFCELGPTVTTTDGSYAMLAPGSAATANYGVRNRGTATVIVTSPASYAAGTTNVLTGIGNLSVVETTARVNGSATTSGAALSGTTYTDQLFHLGARAGDALPFNGKVYGMIVGGAAYSAQTIYAAEQWMAAKSGITF